MKSTHSVLDSSCPAGVQAEELQGHLEDSAVGSTNAHIHSTNEPHQSLFSRLRGRWATTWAGADPTHPPSAVHVNSDGAPAHALTQVELSCKYVPPLSRISTGISDSDSDQPQLQQQQQQQQHPFQSQKRPSSAVATACKLYEELHKQHKQAKHAYLRMHQRARATRLHTSGKARQGRTRRQSAGSTSQHSDLSSVACTPGLGSSPVQDGRALLLPHSALQLQQHQQQDISSEQREQHTNPDLPCLTVIVKMLLQLAVVQAGPAAADVLRQQLLQQVKGMAAAARNAGQQFNVAAALQQALPHFKATVLQACTEATGSVDAAAAAIGIAEAAAVAAEGWPAEAAAVVFEQQGSRSATATLGGAALCGSNRDKSDTAAATTSGIAAIETALLEAACEVQLSSLCLTEPAVPAAADPRGSGTSSTTQVDLEQLLQSELAAVMAEDYCI